jgi:hypothetical protein
MEDLALIVIYSVVGGLYAAMLFLGIFMKPDCAFLDARNCLLESEIVYIMYAICRRMNGLLQHLVYSTRWGEYVQIGWHECSGLRAYIC